MKNTVFIKSSIVLACAATLLVACNSEDQDVGVVESGPQVVQGRAVDGQLARATVFVDSNNNGTRDAWEQFAFTDNDGYYSYNPNTNVDYCASDATAEQSQYCLKSNLDLSGAVIRIDGGYDVLTGEPFAGQMSRRISNDDGNLDDKLLLITPITSLLTNVSDSEHQAILTSLDIEHDDLDVDYLNGPINDPIDVKLLNTALKVHKVVTVLSDKLTDTYFEIGDELGTPNDASSAVYENLAKQIIDSGSMLGDLVDDSSAIVDVLEASEKNLQDIYAVNDIDLPRDPFDFEKKHDAALSADVIADITDSLIPIQDPIDTDAIVGIAKLLEVTVVRATDDLDINDIKEFVENGTDELVSTLVTNLSGDNSDVSGLVNADFGGDDFTSVSGIDSVSLLPADAKPFDGIAGSTIKISDLDLGSRPSDLRDVELAFYFNGSTDDVSGSFEACLKYIDGASIDGTLGDGNTRGELVSGFWSLLGATDDNSESYSLLLTIEFLGATYQAIMKPNGTQVSGDVEYTSVRFDYDGDIRSFLSADGFVSTTSVPTSNAECQAELPSRVGI